MPSCIRYRTAPDTAAGLIRSSAASSAADNCPESATSSTTNTRAGIGGNPAAIRTEENRSMYPDSGSSCAVTTHLPERGTTVRYDISFLIFRIL